MEYIDTYIPNSARILRSITNILMNYIPLVPGVPTRMHFTDDYKIERKILDKETGKLRPIKSLVFWVDRLEGEPCARTFSILSQKLASHLDPFLKNQEYLKYEFVVTKIGDGFAADFNVQPILIP